LVHPPREHVDGMMVLATVGGDPTARTEAGGLAKGTVPKAVGFSKATKGEMARTPGSAPYPSESGVPWLGECGAISGWRRRDLDGRICPREVLSLQQSESHQRHQ